MVKSGSILQRVARGEEGAVQECLDRFGGLVWTLARRFLPGAEDAADAVQDVFIDLWTHASRYDPAVAAESTFVAMIARRRLIDRLRKRGREPRVEPLAEAAAVPAESAADPVERADEVARAAAALATLKPDQQRVLRLSIHDGWTHKQIAERLDMPLGTVKTHARRGLMRVREMLAGGDA